MRGLRRRLGALALVIAMVVPMVATATPTFAAEGDTPEAGRPELFVDFLGDNEVSAGSYSGVLPAPADKDQHISAGGKWDKYDAAESAEHPIFWVGVGISNMANFELAQEGGLYGVELGFYYNSDYVVPYGTDLTTKVSDNAKFRTAVENANLTSTDTKNSWNSSNYQMILAEADVEAVSGRVVSDPATREDQPPENWKLTYVSLQKAGNGQNRFADPDQTETQYIMMIPFQVVQYDPNQALCFKLARDATLFSVGGGDKGYTMWDEANGDSSYGAWEKRTRNPGHNLKEMFGFNGDLNIFTGQKVPPDAFQATLVLKTPGDSTVLMTRAGDSYSPRVDGTPGNSVLGGLSAGSTVDLKINCSDDMTVKVTVTAFNAGDVGVKTITRYGHYTFEMPAEDVTVIVEFFHSEDLKFPADLEIVNNPNDPNGTPEAEKAQNTATMTDGMETVGSGMDSWTIMEVPVNDTLTVDITGCHPGYDVEVTAKATVGDLEVPVTEVTKGKQYTLQMQPFRVKVTVTYTRAQNYPVTLTVDIGSTQNNSKHNQAKLSGYGWEQNADMSYIWALQETRVMNGVEGGSETLYTAGGREMTVDVAVAPGYTAEVLMSNGSNDSTTVVERLKLESSTNVGWITQADLDAGVVVKQAKFTMPTNYTQVKVIFTKAETHRVYAVVDDPDGTGNWFAVEGTDTLGAHRAQSNDTENYIDLIVNTTTVVKLNEGYDITKTRITQVLIQKIVGKNPDGSFQYGDSVSYTGSYINDNISFPMPSDADVEVRVSYADGPAETYTATLTLKHPDGTPVGEESKGWWNDNGVLVSDPAVIKALKGSQPLAEVQVTPGWYIGSVIVLGSSGSYSYTLSGNGWNNGDGTSILEQIMVDNMPGEDIEVIVELLKGPPDPTPKFTAGVQVSDPDNTDGSNNWAKIEINSDGAQPVDGVKKDQNNPYMTPAKVGDKVTVTFEAADGYYVDKDNVTLGPPGAGTLHWLEDYSGVWYIQTAENTMVTVPFVKGTPEAQTVTLHLINPQGADSATVTNNGLTDGTLNKTTSRDGGIVHAFTGDQIDLAAEAASGRWISHLVVMQGGTVIETVPKNLLVNNGGGPQSGYFIMPPGDVDVYVEFTDEEPLPDHYTAALTVTDLSADAATNVGDAGHATMTYTGGSVRADSEGGPSMALVAKDDLVTVEIYVNDGYGLVEVVSSPGTVITDLQVKPGDPNTYTFTMPAQDAGVEVKLRKGEPTKYTANIVLWGPADVSDVLTAGDAWFAKDPTDNHSIYSTTAVPGQGLRVHIAAQPGYEIESVVITPEELGVTAVVAGLYGRQTADFYMPAGNVTVNVTFKHGWPDDKHMATLEVTGPTGSGEAMLSDTAVDNLVSTPMVAPGGSDFIMAQSGDAMEVELAPSTNYKVSSIQITKVTTGETVNYHYVRPGVVGFDMPGSPVLVEVTFEEGEPEDYRATLTYTSGGSGTLSNSVNGSTTGVNGGTITGKAGDMLTVTAVPADGYRLVAVLATKADGTPVPLASPITNNSTTVAMQDQDMTVHLVFAEIIPGMHAAVLQLAGPEAAGATGSIQAGGASASVSMTTSTAPWSTSINAASEDTVTVTASARSGYVIDSVKVTGADNTTITYIWTGAGQVEFTMPAQDVVAVVTFREEPRTEFTAQVIVDNGGNSNNKAQLFRPGKDPDADGVGLRTARPGDLLHVDIQPTVGYEVELVMAVPGELGVTLTGLVTTALWQRQTLDFYMPAGDVQIFVRFREDGKETNNVILTVDDMAAGAPNPGNTANLHSGRSGSTAFVGHGGSVSVKAASGEVVTITANKADGYYVELITKVAGVETKISDLTRETPLEAPNAVYSFPMIPGKDVEVTVVYKLGEPARYHAYLHILQPDGVSGAGTASITNKNVSPVQTTNLDMGMIEGADGHPIDLQADAGAGYFIKAAYVVYDGSTVLDYTPNGTLDMDTVAETFFMQRGDVHVYVVFDDEKNKPEETEYAAVLTVIDLSGKGPGVAGQAVMSRSDGAATVPVLSNDTMTYSTDENGDPLSTPLVVAKHEVLTVPENDTITVLVTVKPGYVVDAVILTPLNKSIPVTPTGNPNEYSFVMPAHNVGVEVRLDEGSREDWYKARLHLAPLEDGSTTDLAGGNLGSITYEGITKDKNNDELDVPATGKVTVTVDPAAGWHVKKAYVISGTEMIELKPALEGSAQTEGEERKSFTAEFVMPSADADVYLIYAEGPAPEEKEYTAAIMMTDPSGIINSNYVTMTDGSNSVTVKSNATHDPLTDTLNVKKDTEMSFEVNIADGYEVDTITVTPLGADGTSVHIEQDDNDPNHYTFTMPDRDVLVHIQLKETEPEGYKATLLVVDRSSAIGNVVNMTNDVTGSMVTGGMGTGSAVLTGLVGTEGITVDAILQPGVAVSAVIFNDAKKGSSFLTGGTTFHGTMDMADVEITVILRDDPDPDPHLHTAVVAINDPSGDPGNSAQISNVTEPALPGGAIWTQAWDQNKVRVDFTAADGYFVKVTAKGADGTVVPVSQFGVTTSGYAIITMPDQDLEILVTYSTEKPEAGNLTLVVVDNTSVADKSVNKATLTWDGGSLNADGVSTTAGAVSVDAGVNISIATAHDPNAHVASVTITTAGGSQRITRPDFSMPVGDATVTVTFEDGVQSARPYDPEFVPNSQYIDGYLSNNSTLKTVVNQGNGVVDITVPVLYTSDGTYKSADEAKFTLYYFDGSDYVLLRRGVDYDLLDDPYDVSGSYNTYTTAKFSIRSLVAGSPLSQYMAQGGVIYITSTEKDANGADMVESEYVDVVIPKDPYAGKYKATLQIVDISSVTGNKAQLSDGTRTISLSGQSLTGLVGTELLKTVAIAVSNATVVSVTATTASGGTELLKTVGLDRYPYTMKNEDVVITVIFADPEPHLYTASVDMVGHQNKPGNSVEIHNSTLPGMLPEGTIWATGYAGHDMTMTIKTEPGFYATVTAVKQSDGSAVPVTVLGGGSATEATTFTSLLSIPDPGDNVQITVTYTKEKPERLENPLTLTIEGDFTGLPTPGSNSAEVTKKTETSPLLTVTDTTPGLSVTTAPNTVTAGTKFDLTTTAYIDPADPTASYYVEKVTLKADNGDGTTTDITVSLDGLGKGEFIMPQNPTEVVVTFVKGERMPRPFDPDHDITDASDPDINTAKDGYILATNLGLDPATQQAKVEVLVPALSGDDGANLETAWSDTAPVGYKFYIQNIYGNYVELPSTDLAVSAPVQVPASDGSGIDGAKMTLTALNSNSQIALWMKKGGSIYVTANDGTVPPEKNESRYTEVVIPANYTATLYIKGTGMSTVASGATLATDDGMKSTSVNGGVISGLTGMEGLTTNVTVASGEVLVGVIVTVDGAGSTILTGNNPYHYTMDQKDVEITVVLAPDGDPLPYVATVKQEYIPAGTTPKLGNTADIANVTTTGMANGDIWAAGYEKDKMEVTVTTEPGWYATVTAHIAGDPSTPVGLIQWGASGRFTAELDMPANNVEVTVTYSQTPPPPQELTLEMVGDFGIDLQNTSRLTWNGDLLAVYAPSVTTDGPKQVAVGEALALDARHGANHHIAKVEITVGSGQAIYTAPLVLLSGKSSFTMPYNVTKVTVTYGDGAPSARPYYPDHVPAADPGSQEGWILADNLGSGKLEIEVPVLFPGLGEGRPYQDALAEYTYTLYLKTGSGYVKLDEGTDYDNVTKTEGNYYTDYTGVRIGLEAQSRRMKDLLVNGGTLYITATQEGFAESEFTEVIVEARGEEHTATLVIVDHSSGVGSTVTMTDGTNTATANGDSFQTGGASTLTTTVVANQATVKVLATNDNGTVRLTDDGSGNYLWDMDDQDTVITVVLDNYDMYIATVKKAGDDGMAGNTATVSNSTNPSLPGGTIWTGAHEGDMVQVDVTTAVGYYATVSAVDTKNGTVSVLQMGVTGNNVTAYVVMPADDVEILVTYSKNVPIGKHIVLNVNGTEGLGQLEHIHENGVVDVIASCRATNTAVWSVTDIPVTGSLRITGTPDPGHYVERVQLEQNGITVDLTLGEDGTLTIPMPAGDVTVTITFAEGPRMARPYDPDHESDYVGTPYIKGYLDGENQGSGRVLVDIPNLYDGKETTPLQSATQAEKFNFYTKDGAGYTKLIEDEDYEIVDETVYGHDAYEGVKLTLHVLKGESALAQYVSRGGVIYITAVAEGSKESEYVDVVIDADPLRGKYTARLQIDDPAGKADRPAAVLYAGSQSVTDSGTIRDLTGTEQLKTIVLADSPYLLGVTVTDEATGATTWLKENPDGSLRYPYFMHSESVVITVHYASDDDVYIATVKTSGYTGVAGNQATVVNALRNDLSKGMIWAAGYVGDDMKVTVKTAKGYYAKVTAVREDDGSTVAVYPHGGGDGVDFDSVLTMPGNPGTNVQINVEFVKEEPEDWYSTLTLAMNGGSGNGVNQAKLTSTDVSPKIELTVDGVVTPTDSESKVATNTQFTLWAQADNGWYVEKVQVEAQYDTDGVTELPLATPVDISISLKPGTTNEWTGSFTMPLGGAKVVVYYKEGERTPRPFEPDHMTPGANDPSQQPGWLQAMPVYDGSGVRVADTVQVTIPVLSDDGIKTETVENTIFKLYTKGAYPNYNPLAEGTDITVTYGSVTADGITLTLKAEASKLLHYYMQEGGIIYITATKPGENGAARGESDYTEIVIPANRKATLHIEQDTFTGNKATMEIKGSDPLVSVLADPTDQVIDGLTGTETLIVRPQPTGEVRLAGVVATTKSGSVNLTEETDPQDGSIYFEYEMENQDVTLTVVFYDGYIAAVQKDDGGLNLAGNTADIIDQDHTTIDGDIWAVGRPGDTMQVSVTTEPGWSAMVKAYIVNPDGTRGAEVKVFQWAYYGSFTAQFTMPEANVDVEVTYGYVAPPLPGGLILKVEGTTNKGNSAQVLIDGIDLLQANDNNPTTDQMDCVQTGVELKLTTNVASGNRLVSVELKLPDGTSKTVTTYGGAAIETMPFVFYGEFAELIVTFADDGEQTARPYDPDHDPAAAPGTEPGWLLAVNPGSGLLEITVPTLTKDEGTTLEDAYWDAIDTLATYKLYWRNALGNYKALGAGTDFTLVGTPSVVNGVYNGENRQGIRFTIQADLSDPGVDMDLKDVLNNGGFLYITATKDDQGESEWTQVVVPKPEPVDFYTLTLRISDQSDDAANNTVVLRDSKGSELKKDKDTMQEPSGEPLTTTVTLNDSEKTEIRGVIVTTQSGGSVYLPQKAGTDPAQYDYTMPAEDATVTVVIVNKDAPEYMAIVKKNDRTGTGITDMPTIKNTTDGTLPKGEIWTMARVEDGLRVDFDGGAYYVWVIAHPESNAGNLLPVYQTAFKGKGTALLSMPTLDPQENILITVIYSKTPPPANTLRLVLQGHDQEAQNAAEIKVGLVTGTQVLSTDGSKATSASVVASASMSDVPAGTQLDLMAGHAPGYYIESVILETADGYSLPLSLDILGQAGAVMQRANTTITVKYAQGNYSPRPYDPVHATVADDDAGTQPGWLEAVNNGDGSALVTVPTLMGEKERCPDDLEDVIKETTFAFYIYDEDTLTYVKLTDADYTYGPETWGNIYYPDGTPDSGHYAGVEFPLTAVPGGRLEPLMTTGGTIYITATKPGSDENGIAWVESHKTELVIPRATIGLRPYDPDRVNADGEPEIYEDHWIRAENRGDYMVVTVPTLADGNDSLYNVDMDKHTFNLYLMDDPQADALTYLDLAVVVNVTHPDPENVTDPYENEVYYPNYQGARFEVHPKTVEELEAEATEDDGGIKVLPDGTTLDDAITLLGRLTAILDNDGTVSGADGKERLYITCSTKIATDDDPDAEPIESEYVDLEVPQYYAFYSAIKAYAPQHAGTAALYRLDEGGDPDDPDAYETEAAIEVEISLTTGMGLWQIPFAIKSSELPDQCYKLVITKPGHVSYTWLGLDLSMDNLDKDTEPDEPACGTFTTKDIIPLFGGDLDGDDQVKVFDREILIDFIGGKYSYTRVLPADKDADPTGWTTSVYNPETLAYRADLDGDGYVTVMDLSIITAARNDNKTVDDNVPPPGLMGEPATTMLLEELMVLENQLPVVGELDGVADDEAGTEVEEGGELQPEEPGGGEVGPDDTADPVTPIDPMEPDGSDEPAVPPVTPDNSEEPDAEGTDGSGGEEAAPPVSEDVEEEKSDPQPNEGTDGADLTENGDINTSDSSEVTAEAPSDIQNLETVETQGLCETDLVAVS